MKKYVELSQCVLNFAAVVCGVIVSYFGCVHIDALTAEIRAKKAHVRQQTALVAQQAKIELFEAKQRIHEYELAAVNEKP